MASKFSEIQRLLELAGAPVDGPAVQALFEKEEEKLQQLADKHLIFSRGDDHSELIIVSDKPKTADLEKLVAQAFNEDEREILYGHDQWDQEKSYAGIAKDFEPANIEVITWPELVRKTKASLRQDLQGK